MLRPRSSTPPGRPGRRTTRRSATGRCPRRRLVGRSGGLPLGRVRRAVRVPRARVRVRAMPDPRHSSGPRAGGAARRAARLVVSTAARAVLACSGWSSITCRPTPDCTAITLKLCATTSWSSRAIRRRSSARRAGPRSMVSRWRCGGLVCQSRHVGPPHAHAVADKPRSDGDNDGKSQVAVRIGRRLSHRSREKEDRTPRGRWAGNRASSVPGRGHLVHREGDQRVGDEAHQPLAVASASGGHQRSRAIST